MPPYLPPSALCCQGLDLHRDQGLLQSGSLLLILPRQFLQKVCTADLPCACSLEHPSSSVRAAILEQGRALEGPLEPGETEATWCWCYG